LQVTEDESDIEMSDNFLQANSIQEDSEVDEIELPDKKLKRNASSTSGDIRKCRRTSVYETAASTTADGMMSLGDSIKDAQLLPQLTRFDQCIEVLNEMKTDKSLSNKEYFSIVKVFMREEEHHSALFVGMPMDMRMEWLIEEKWI
jgi:hypothetical protein